MEPTDKKVIVEKGKPKPRNNHTMFVIFQNVQYNVVQHKKYVKEMTKLYKEIPVDLFKESFKNALYYLFTFGDTSANVDRVIQFVASFSTSLDDEEEFLMFIFDVIFECQSAAGQSVRYRASQLLAAVLASLGEEASLDDDLCDKLLFHQLQRLQDTRGAVRCRAALALNRLQNPSDPNDEVTRGYRFHMSCDPSSSVRRAVVISIAKCSRNVPFVLERLCDVDDNVRRAAFLYISAMNVTQLRVKQRVLTLKVGLTERSQRVRRVVEEILIPTWLAAFHGNIIDFLKAIRLDNSHDAKDSQYVAEKLLESLFKRLPISELLEWLPTDKSLRLIPADKLNKETAWYWRNLAEHLQKNNDDETLETMLPDLVVLTGYIKTLVESPCPSEEQDPVSYSTRHYVLNELAKLLRAYDTSDPAGRDALQNLITDTLTGDYGTLSEEFIRALVSALQLVLPDVNSRVEMVSNILSTLRDPPEIVQEVPQPTIDDTEAKLQRARLRVSLNVAIEAQEEAVRHENYTLAAQCKAKVADIQKQLEELTVQTKPEQPLNIIKEKQCDVATLNKCLIIINALLDSPQLNSITPMLKVIFSEFEVEIFQNPELLENALETVALYGMLDKEFARDHKAFFFANLVDSTNESTVSKVLKCVVDLLCVHGANLFDYDNETNSTKNGTKNSINTSDNDESTLSLNPGHPNVIELLLKMMDNVSSAHRLIIVEGLCRLMYLGHLESPYILSKLILLWFNPVSAEEDVLRQTIGIFFQNFPAKVDSSQDQIQKAIIPTLRTLSCAPSSSPISEIDQEALVKFFVSLTKVSHELADSQGAMALVLCNYLVRKPTEPECALVCRALALLSPPKDSRTAADLAAMLRDLCLKLQDKQSCRNLTRYLGALEAMEKSSINKMSNTGVTDSVQAEDTMNMMGRATTSLPQPLARSTHVVVNETVEEEPEIDENSPNETGTEPNSRISGGKNKNIDTLKEAEQPEKKKSKGKNAKRNRSKNSITNVTTAKSDEKSKEQELQKSPSSDDRDDANVMTSRSGRGLQSGPTTESSETSKGKKKVTQKDMKAKSDDKSKEQELQKSPSSDDRDDANVMTSRSGRGQQSGPSNDSTKTIKGKQKVSQKAKNAKSDDKSKEQELQKSPSSDDRDDANVMTSRSGRGLQSGPTTESSETSKGKKKVTQKDINETLGRSKDDSFFDSDDTELHTIVYDSPVVQELLNDSSELTDSRRSSKANVTIPETPDASEESDTEIEVPVKGKGKKRAGK